MVLEKLPVFRLTLLILVLSISVISLLPTSLEQQFTTTNNPNGTRSIKGYTSDHTSLQEGTNRTVIQNAVQAQMIEDFRNEAWLLGVIGISATIVGTLGGYLLSKRHLETTIDKAIAKTETKMIEIVNAQLRVKDGGKVAKHDDKIGADVERGVNEQENVGEKVSIVKKSERPLTENVPVEANVGLEVIRKKDSESEQKEKKDDLSKGVKL